MVIDFHTHTFPDKIAKKTLDFLSHKGGGIPYYLDGTLTQLKESMKKCGVDWSVILPIATKPEQTSSINRLAFELSGKDGIIYAGAIHPDCENIDEVLDSIKNAGLFGIKLHPDYQDVYFNDPRVLRILEGAAKRGLYTVVHAGRDVAFPDDIHCTPDHVLEVLEKLGPVINDKLILAHLGSCDGDIAEIAYEKLCGKPVYMDTAVVLDRFPEMCVKIIKKHGVDKVLFATDSPWAKQDEFISLLRGMDFTEEELDMMFYKNGQKILANAGITV